VPKEHLLYMAQPILKCSSDCFVLDAEVLQSSSHSQSSSVLWHLVSHEQVLEPSFDVHVASATRSTPEEGPTWLGGERPTHSAANDAVRVRVMPMISTAPVVRMAKPPEEKISRLSDQL
jgi:hypothetical protein